METPNLERLAQLLEWQRFEKTLEGFTIAGQPVTLEPLWIEDRIYGYRIKSTLTHHIDLCRMIFNWRIITVPKNDPWFVDRGWCYQGTGLAGFLPAALAAIAWDGANDTEPPGYFKRVGA
jgi:hypothetical protein